MLIMKMSDFSLFKYFLMLFLFNGLSSCSVVGYAIGNASDNAKRNFKKTWHPNGQKVPFDYGKLVKVHSKNGNTFIGKVNKVRHFKVSDERNSFLVIRYRGQKNYFPFEEIDKVEYGIKGDGRVIGFTMGLGIDFFVSFILMQKMIDDMFGGGD